MLNSIKNPKSKIQNSPSSSIHHPTSVPIQNPTFNIQHCLQPATSYSLPATAAPPPIHHPTFNIQHSTSSSIHQSTIQHSKSIISRPVNSVNPVKKWSVGNAHSAQPAKFWMSNFEFWMNPPSTIQHCLQPATSLSPLPFRSPVSGFSFFFTPILQILSSCLKCFLNPPFKIHNPKFFLPTPSFPVTPESRSAWEDRQSSKNSSK